MSVLVQVRNGSLQRVAEADDYSALSCVAASCDVGSWHIELPAASSAAMALTYSGGLIVERNGQPFISGPVVSMKVSSRRVTKRKVVEMLTADGVSDTAWLGARRALPTPLGPPYPDAYDDHTQPLETLLRGYVDRNLGPSAIAARQLPGLVLETDGGNGPTVRGLPDRFDSLLSFMQDTIAPYLLSFRIIQIGTALHLQFYVPRDLSASVVFGLDRGNLADYSYGTTRPTANYLYAGGEGDLGARLIREDGDDASIGIFGRIEGFLDDRNAPDAAYLDQKIAEGLVDQSANSVLSITPIDAPDTMYGLDYLLDDTVGVRLSGTENVITDRVRQIKLSVDSKGQELLTPVVASDGANLSGVNLVSLLRRMRRSLTRLETRS